MRRTLNLTDRAKDRLGQVTVALVLVVAILATSGCGDSGVPESSSRVGDRPASTEPSGSRGSVTPRRPAVVATTPTSVAPTTTTDPVQGFGQVPGSPVSYEDAENAYHDRRYDEAVLLFSAYTGEHPKNPWGHYMLGLSGWKDGRYDTAEEAFNVALDLDPKHVKSLLNLSRVFLETVRPREAIELLDQALEIDGELGEAYRLLGRTYVQLGDDELAEESYQQAIVLNEEDAWAMNNLGWVLIRQERFDEALLPLARAVQVRDDVAVFHNNLGIALERTGHVSSSADAYKTAVEIDETHNKAVVNLARVEQFETAAGGISIDLPVLAQDFVEVVEQWRRDISSEELVDEKTDEKIGEVGDEQVVLEIPIVDSTTTGEIEDDFPIDLEVRTESELPDTVQTTSSTVKPKTESKQ